MAQGFEKASEAYGGEEFAMGLGVNGLPGYHTGYASMLGTIVGGRHSHNNNAGYDIDRKMLHKTVKPSIDQIVDALIKENEWRCVLTSLVICPFCLSRLHTENGC